MSIIQSYLFLKLSLGLLRNAIHILLLIIILYGNSLIAQSEVMLKNSLNVAQHDTTKIRIYHRLSEICEINEVDKYSNLVIELCEKNIKNTPISDSLYNFYLIHIANSYNNKGFSKFHTGEIESSIIFYNKALNIHGQTKYLAGIGNTLGNLGFVYFKQGNYAKAMEYYEKSYNVRKKINDLNGLSNTLHNIALIYQQLGNYSKALDYNLKSLKYREKLNDKEGIAYSLNNIGSIYQSTGKLKEAYSYYEKSLAIRQEIKDDLGIVYSLNSLGYINIKLKEYQKALYFFEQSLVIETRINDKLTTSSALNGLAVAQYNLGQPEIAMKNATKSLEIAQELGFPETIEAVSEFLSKIYKQKGDYKNAYHMQILHKRMSDSINNKEYRKELYKKDLISAFGRKAISDSLTIINSQKVFEYELGRKNKQNALLYCSIGIISVFSFFLYRRYRITQNQKLIIEKQKRDVEQQKELAEDQRKIAEAQKIVISNSIDEISKSRQKMKEAKEEAERANNAKTRFLSNISHEIRTPLNAVLGFSELLKGNTKSEKFEKYNEGILIGGKSLLALINDLLELSKIEAGQLKMKKSRVDLRVLINELKHVFTISADSKRLNYHMEINYHSSANCILIDEMRLRQILFNLLGNAFKFTDKGSVTLSLDVTASSSNSNNVNILIEVKDTGIGIPFTQQDLIFESFIQQEDQDTKRYGGTGLGLSISKKLVEMMGGKIELESVPGIGSNFKVILNEVEVSLDDDCVSKNIDCQFKGQKVLIAEDNFSNKEVLKGFLENCNLDVFTVENGKDAIELMKSIIPDIILVDKMMPVMDGFTTVKSIRSENKFDRIPIIGLTAAILNENDESFKNICDDYLIKPFEKTTFISVLCKYLDNVSSNENKSDYKLYTEKKDNKNILIVEDNELNQKLLGCFLDKYGYKYVIAEDGEKAIDFICSRSFDLILMDINLPLMNGLEIIDVIKSRIDIETPIVAISGNTEESFINLCLSKGFANYLTKPIDLNNLNKVISELLFLKSAPEIENFKFDNKSKVGLNYSYANAIELCSGDKGLLNKWLLEFYELLKNAQNSVLDISNKIKNGESVKYFHDLKNYSIYFKVDNIISIISSIQGLDKSDSDFDESLKRLLIDLNEELISAIGFYSNVIENSK